MLQYGVKVDIWALGMLVLEIVGKGETPLHSMAPKKVLEHLVVKKKKLFFYFSFSSNRKRKARRDL